MSLYQDLSEAFAIFAKYPGEAEGLAISGDYMLSGPHPDNVTDEDKARLKELGWEPGDEDCFERTVPN